MLKFLFVLIRAIRGKAYRCYPCNLWQTKKNLLKSFLQSSCVNFVPLLQILK